MQLLLHIGIHKTGSSYLQYLCSNLREELQNYGIWFPLSDQESKMDQGIISAGNALEVCTQIRKQNIDGLVTHLQMLRNQAEANGCDKLLLSAEGLGHDFSQKYKLHLFNETARKVSFEKVSVIAYFRDLIDHSVSLYKHRSKSGNNKDFEYWLRNEYETPQLLNDFFNSYNTVEFDWTFYKFKKDSDYMRNTFFKEWLNVEFSSFPSIPTVNESLTLSEIKVMQSFKEHYRNTSEVLQKKFLALHKNEKAKDKDFENSYKTIAGKVMNSLYCDDLNRWNDHLIGDCLSIDGCDSNMSSIEGCDLCLSDTQIKKILEASSFLSSYKSFFYRFKKSILIFLPTSVLSKIRTVFKSLK